MTLMETKQTVPEFLQEFAPTGAEADNLKFEPDTDEEDNGANGANGGADGGDGADGWGAPAGANGDSATKKQGDDDDASGGSDSKTRSERNAPPPPKGTTSTAKIERHVFLPLGLVIGSQLLGLVPLFIFNHTPSNVRASSTFIYIH